VTTTCSVVAVPGAAVADGAGLGEVFCAIAMLAHKSSALAAVNIFFIEVFKEIDFSKLVFVEAFAAANARSVWIRRSPR